MHPKAMRGSGWQSFDGTSICIERGTILELEYDLRNNCAPWLGCPKPMMVCARHYFPEHAHRWDQVAYAGSEC
jgi:hypothetical protein